MPTSVYLFGSAFDARADGTPSTNLRYPVCASDDPKVSSTKFLNLDGFLCMYLGARIFPTHFHMLTFATPT